MPNNYLLYLLGCISKYNQFWSQGKQTAEGKQTTDLTKNP